MFLFLDPDSDMASLHQVSPSFLLCGVEVKTARKFIEKKEF
jgi:hypothetical protein